MRLALGEGRLRVWHSRGPGSIDCLAERIAQTVRLSEGLPELEGDCPERARHVKPAAGSGDEMPQYVRLPEVQQERDQIGERLVEGQLVRIAPRVHVVADDRSHSLENLGGLGIGWVRRLLPARQPAIELGDRPSLPFHTPFVGVHGNLAVGVEDAEAQRLVHACHNDQVRPRFGNRVFALHGAEPLQVVPGRAEPVIHPPQHRVHHLVRDDVLRQASVDLRAFKRRSVRTEKIAEADGPGVTRVVGIRLLLEVGMKLELRFVLDLAGISLELALRQCTGRPSASSKMRIARMATA